MHFSALPCYLPMRKCSDWISRSSESLMPSQSPSCSIMNTSTWHNNARAWKSTVHQTSYSKRVIKSSLPGCLKWLMVKHSRRHLSHLAFQCFCSSICVGLAQTLPCFRHAYITNNTPIYYRTRPLLFSVCVQSVALSQTVCKSESFYVVLLFSIC